MLPPSNIHLQPSSQNCLAWSSDGELAVAAGEEVYFLISQVGNPDPWIHVRITVNHFTTKEWSWQELASFKDMSIGEEQARATVTALEWSPPGLAKHGRCVLAVLTSNLILSLWASDSNPTDLESWKRVVIVNKALPLESRLQRRIRSMAWVPMNPQHIDRRTPFSGRKWGIPLIAIADDNYGLYILKVSSPFVGQSFAWNVEVLHRHCVPVPNRSNDRPSLLALAMNANHFVDRIEIGTWDGEIPVVYRISGIIHRASLSVHEEPSSRAPSKDVLDLESFTVRLGQASLKDANLPSKLGVTPHIKARMLMEKEKVGLERNIGSDTVLRTRGQASFNSLVAACVTLHPTKMVEHIAPSEGVATILFDAGNDEDNAKSEFPWQSPVKIDVAMAQRTILDTILDEDLHRRLALNNLDLKTIYSAFCGGMLLKDYQRFQRPQTVMDILYFIERHGGIDLLPEHIALLTIRDSHQLSDQEPIRVIAQMTEVKGKAELSSVTPEISLLDLCPFCPEVQHVLPFDSFTEANCPRGHSFGKLFSAYSVVFNLQAMQQDALLHLYHCSSRE